MRSSAPSAAARARRARRRRIRPSAGHDLAACISHEFRTPLTAIRGFAETLLRGGIRDRRERTRFLKLIEENADRLDKLVDEHLDLPDARG